MGRQSSRSARRVKPMRRLNLGLTLIEEKKEVFFLLISLAGATFLLLFVQGFSFFHFFVQGLCLLRALDVHEASNETR